MNLSELYAMTHLFLVFTLVSIVHVSKSHLASQIKMQLIKFPLGIEQ